MVRAVRRLYQMMNTGTLNPARHFLATFFCLLLVACGGPSEGPEAALRAWVAQGQELAEEKDRRGLVDMISPAYIDARGNERDDNDVSHGQLPFRRWRSGPRAVTPRRPDARSRSCPAGR